MLKRWSIRIGVTVVALAALAAALYSYGGMWPASAEVRAAYAEEVAAGRQPAVEYAFTIPIPGCVCHSDDPVLQMQHSTRRISGCTECHVRS